MTSVRTALAVVSAAAVLMPPVRPMAAAAAPSGFALVIGNATYADSPLHTPLSDAASIADLLTLRGYDVTLRTELDGSDAQSVVREFRQRIAGTPLPILFYFAGHGVQVNGVNYLIPVRERIATQDDVRTRTLSVSTIFDALSGAARLSPKIIILDACRPNPFGETSTVDWTPGFAPPVDAPANSLVVYSTDPGNVAADGIGLHSPFARALLRYVGEPGLPVEQLFKVVRQDVETHTDLQRPTEFSRLTSKDFSVSPALLLGTTILDGDDDVTVSVNGVEVADWNGDSRQRRTAPLHSGVNEVLIKVYNQRSYTGGVPFLGGHYPEGWRYHAVFDGPLPGARLEMADREDRPDDNGPRHGKLFTAARFDIVVDARTLETSIARKVVGPWK